MKRFLIKTNIIIIITAFTGCLSTGTALRDIRANPNLYTGKRVKVEGLVTDSISVPVKGGVVYRIFEDNTDSIWVYANSEKPVRGDRVSVIGTVSDNKSFRSKITGVYILEERRSKK